MATSEGWKAILSRETPRCQREDVTTSQSVTNQVRACGESSDKIWRGLRPRSFEGLAWCQYGGKSNKGWRLG
jgi:hypothetical protein